ncbi:MAG: hypothetical protein AUJ92_01625 [Armatimonadetes bacterium CG2_30_59_28]|nr:MAG: hypothetical protein AUJ92_01625 [Armatimonadetes bacterium CG2_30_59_28]
MLAAIMVAPAFAQQPNVEQLMKELENLRKRVDELEKMKNEDFPKVKEETAKLSKSAKDLEKKAKELQISGDVRFRYDHQENLLAGATDRGRERVRLRMKGAKKVDNYIDFGMMLATAADPISDNQTLESIGQDFGIYLDQAFIGYSPNGQRSRLVGGVIPNPFMSTEMIWDSDYNFPGLALSHALKQETEESPGEVKVVLGQFVVDEEGNNADARLTAIQLQGKNSRVGLSGAVSYYKYSSTLDPGDVPGGARGNVTDDVAAPATAFVSGFAPLDFIVKWDLPQPEGKLPIGLTLNYVTNTDADDLNKGWSIQAAFNKKPSRKNDWQLLTQSTVTSRRTPRWQPLPIQTGSKAEEPAMAPTSRASKRSTFVCSPTKSRAPFPYSILSRKTEATRHPTGSSSISRRSSEATHRWRVGAEGLTSVPTATATVEWTNHTGRRTRGEKTSQQSAMDEAEPNRLSRARGGNDPDGHQESACRSQERDSHCSRGAGRAAMRSGRGLREGRL